MLASIITADAVTVYTHLGIFTMYLVCTKHWVYNDEKKCIDLTFYWWETNNKQEYVSQKEIK